MRSMVRDVLLSWRECFLGKKKKKTWKAALLYLVWIILNERNRKTFDNSEKTDQTIKQFFMYNFLKWVRMYKGGCFLFMMDFIDWLSFK